MTVRAREELAREIDEARRLRRPLAKDRLEQLADIAFEEMTARRETSLTGNGEAVAARAEYAAWFDRAVYAAKELAKYQSPQYRAIAVSDVTVQRPPLNLDRLSEKQLLQLLDLIVLAGPVTVAGGPSALTDARLDRAGSGETQG
jgi:hypothetical protein